MESAVAGPCCALRDRIEVLIGPGKFRTWFGDGASFEIVGNVLRVTVKQQFTASWIATNFLPQLIEAAREFTEGEPTVELHVEPAQAGAVAGDGAEQKFSRRTAAEPARGEDRSALRGDLDSFVVGATNALAHSAAVNVVRAPLQGPRPLVIHGACGLGKTHLLQGICNGVVLEHPTLVCCYVSGEEFTNDFIHTLRVGRTDAFRARFRKFDVLVIDDIHFLANKKATQDEFLHTFNAIDSCGKAIVVSSDRHPRMLTDLSEQLVSRLLSGMVVQIKPPDFATRCEILRRRAAAMQRDLSDEVIEFMARHITRNVRELEGALYRISATAALNRTAVTLEMVRPAIDEYVGGVLCKGPDAAEIERMVAAKFHVTREELRSKGRDRTLSLARGVAMYLIRKHTRMSFPEIGRMLGNKNHSTVLMAHQRIERVLTENGAVAWKAASGVQEAPLREVLESIEQEFPRGQIGAA